MTSDGFPELLHKVFIRQILFNVKYHFNHVIICCFNGIFIACKLTIGNEVLKSLMRPISSGNTGRRDQLPKNGCIRSKRAVMNNHNF